MLAKVATFATDASNALFSKKNHENFARTLIANYGQ